MPKTRSIAVTVALLSLLALAVTVALLRLLARGRHGGVEMAGRAEMCASTDVLIVGAGFAGLAAAKELRTSGVEDFLVVESTNRVGGRVSSVQPPGFGGIWVEEGAGWVVDVEDNPVFDLMLAQKRQFTLNNFRDFKMFEFDPKNTTRRATRLNMDQPNQRYRDTDRAFLCVDQETRKNIDPSLGEGQKDNGVLSLLKNCGLETFSNVDFALKWYFIDYEFNDRDTSITSFPTAYPDAYLVVDQNGGYGAAAFQFAKDEGIFPTRINFNRAVTNVNYDFIDPINRGFKVKVDVTDPSSSCDYYLANYVILTVPVGVIEHGLVTFQPELDFDDGPMKTTQYAKIYYKFDFRVGPKYKNEFLFALKPGPGSSDNNDHCLSWQNLDAKRNSIGSGTKTTYLPGSNIWLCTLVTEAYEKLLAANDGMVLSDDQIDTLLNPLRQIFPETPITRANYTYYTPSLNLRDSFGRGAYGNRKIGSTYRDFFEFYGGGPIKRCLHNGCDSDEIWRLHISGSASCFSQSEFVHGAYFAGQRSARYVMAEMGMEVETFDRCEDFPDTFVLE